MRTTAVRIVPLMALMVPFLYAPSSRGGQNDIRQSVVKVLATRRAPDVFRPWTKRDPEEVSGIASVARVKTPRQCRGVRENGRRKARAS